MCHVLQGGASLHRQLLAIDRQLAEEAHGRGCPECSSRLHRADYPRKPRGAPEGLGVEFERRFSFCCEREGCRKRLTPPSVRFLGRRVWLSVVVTMACVAAQGLTPRRTRVLRETLGLDRRTLERWCVWWREEFPATRAWRELRGKLGARVNQRELPRSLFESIAGDEVEKQLGILRLLQPVSHSERMAQRCAMGL